METNYDRHLRGRIGDEKTAFRSKSDNGLTGWLSSKKRFKTIGVLKMADSKAAITGEVQKTQHSHSIRFS